jgi:hypothetical protein
VIEGGLGFDQGAHDFDVAEVGGGDQCGAVILAGDVARAAAAGERDLQHLDIVLHRGDGDDVVVLRVHRIRVGAETQQRLHHRVLAAERGDVQRRAAVGILEVRLLAFGNQLFDLGDIAVGGGGVQAGIDLQFTLGWRGLCHQWRRCGAEQRQRSDGCRIKRKAADHGTSRPTGAGKL